MDGDGGDRRREGLGELRVVWGVERGELLPHWWLLSASAWG